MPEPSAASPSPEDQAQTYLPHLAPGTFLLQVTFDVAAGGFRFDWFDGQGKAVATGLLIPHPNEIKFFSGLRWAYRGEDELATEEWPDHCGVTAPSVHALLKRIRLRRALAAAPPQIGIRSDVDVGQAKSNQWLGIRPPPKTDAWLWLGREVVEFAKLMDADAVPIDRANYARDLMYLRVSHLLGVATARPRGSGTARYSRLRSTPTLLHLKVDFDRPAERTRFTWFDPLNRAVVSSGEVRCAAGRQFAWLLSLGDTEVKETTAQTRNAIRQVVGGWLKRFPTTPDGVTLYFTKSGKVGTDRQSVPVPADDIYPAIEEAIFAMGESLREPAFAPPGDFDGYDLASGFAAYQRRQERKEQKRAEEAARREANLRRLAEERRREDEQAQIARATSAARQITERQASGKPPPGAAPRPPVVVPPVAVNIRLPTLNFQDTVLPLADLQNFTLRERAALWWVSNQSDDLLCLPHCRIEHLDFQVRTALRVLGPLRGRALLSDEVGLGKTIEAGLVLKELLTRGMVKRFLVLTLPSLVDQWTEELQDKFGLTAATTNLPASREDPAKFWRENTALVASLHTLKQPAHLEIARQLQWDLLIVDEAHYLRNRESQSWQAVNVLPRQFLLLLTATPVQNSLEELYNLVTLLMPGQLPTPKEFRTRFLDPKRPRQPREPEELRRLLGQVMIRNTRANSGIKLPPRRAETVLFTPAPAEGEFWRQWETEFRASLARLSGSQSSLWGRLLLRAAGSSPAAWRAALQKFPEAAAARQWRDHAPLDASWRRKCELLLPLARGTGGVVVFTEFLETQAAIADSLRGAGVAAFVINGATPAPERQPITERFRENGGALVLTHSGTEGRNLQFCHRLANFDLPWNPMEIEQRIGRLHRLGQRHPVEIHNFVQAGTLQEHLLQILQEKLNLFELVVGETGLVLGERYSGDEFEEEVFRRWRESDGRVGEALGALGAELAAARDHYREVKDLDETLFAQDYETL